MDFTKFSIQLVHGRVYKIDIDSSKIVLEVSIYTTFVYINLLRLIFTVLHWGLSIKDVVKGTSRLAESVLALLVTGMYLEFFFKNRS